MTLIELVLLELAIVLAGGLAAYSLGLVYQTHQTVLRIESQLTARPTASPPLVEADPISEPPQTDRQPRQETAALPR